MSEIWVELGDRSYPIVIGARLSEKAPALLKTAGLSEAPLLIVTDESVAAAQAETLDGWHNLPGHRTELVVLPPGEETKSLRCFSMLLDRIAAFDEGDGAAIVAFGGGVIGDLSGFTAACYKRGIPWVQVPTTLLAQVDASVGGKTAINHPSAKNLVGAFHQPRIVVADMSTLSTLPSRELRSGLAEVVKHGVIEDAVFFHRIEQTMPQALAVDPAVLEDYVESSCRIKARIVGEDERDTGGRRALLNYGHTFGHAIELAAHFNYAHGEAIAIGMACAGDLSVRLGLWPAADARRVEAALVAAGLPVSAQNTELARVMEAMRLDKKFENGLNRFILAHGIGHVEIHKNLPDEMILETLRGRIEMTV